MTSNVEVLDRFAKEYQAYHGMSADRRKGQLRELAKFSGFADKPLVECGAPEFKSYLSYLVSLDLHVNTVRFRGNLIRPFYSWCFEAGLVSGDTLLRIRGVPNPKGATNQSDPKPYSPKELKQFWKDLDARWPLVKDKWWKYWRQGRSKYKRVASEVMRLQLEAIVALALDCGLRPIEIYSAEIDHIHPDNAYIVVPQRGERKNGKDRSREVPMTKEARAALRRWFAIREELKPKHDRPWLSAVANQAAGGWLKPLRHERFTYLMTTIGEYELHRFRHTCATNWLRAEMDLEKVQKLLGHSSIMQTQMYAEIVREDVQKQVDKNEARFIQLTHRPKRKEGR